MPSRPTSLLPGFLRYASLEVAAGAVAANLAAHFYLSGRAALGAEQALIALAALGIYGLDRLADVRRGNALKPEHRFFQDHFKAMAVFTLACCIAGTLLAAYEGLSRPEVLTIGGPIALASGVYLLAVQATRRLRLPYIKEPWIAIIYSSAIWTLPILESPELARPGLMMLLAWMLLAMLNLLISNAEESGYDRAEGNSTLPNILGPRITTWLTYLLLGGLLYCCGTALRYHDGLFPWVTVGLGVATVVLGFLPPRPGMVLSKRFIADALLILSLLALIW